MTQSSTACVTHCSPNSMVCSASLPLRWISTKTLCGIISEASHRIGLHTKRRPRRLSQQLRYGLALRIRSRTARLSTGFGRVLFSPAPSGEYVTIFLNSTLLCFELRRLIRSCNPLRSGRSMQLNASLCMAKAHQTSCWSHTMIRTNAIGDREVHPTRATPSVVKGPALCPSSSRTRGAAQRAYTAPTACQLRVEPPSPHPRSPAATPRSFKVHASFVRRRVNPSNSMCKLNLSCCSYGTCSLSARFACLKGWSLSDSRRMASALYVICMDAACW